MTEMDDDRPQRDMGPTPGADAVAPRLLESLVCPATGGKLVLDRARGELVSKAAGLAYPIRSGIPIMLIDEARKLDE